MVVLMCSTSPIKPRAVIISSRGTSSPLPTWRRQTAARLSKGGIELEGGDQADIHFVAPAAGRYEVRCTHFMHKSFGMKGEIIVR